MKRTIGLFKTTDDAERAVNVLKRAGFLASEIAVVLEPQQNGLGSSNTADTTDFGAVSGELVEMLSEIGVSNEHAHIYSEDLRRGGAVVAVRTEEPSLTSVEKILRENGAADLKSRVDDHRAGAWDPFHLNASAPQAAPLNVAILSDHVMGTVNGVVQTEASVNPARMHDSSGTGNSMAGNPVAGNDEVSRSKLGTAAGALSGAATGAVVGSAGGPLGTIVGGLVGAVVGGGLGGGLDAAATSDKEFTRIEEAQDAIGTSGWHNHGINSDADERERSEDTTGLAGVFFRDVVQETRETNSSDHSGPTVEERMERAKAKSVKGKAHS